MRSNAHSLVTLPIIPSTNIGTHQRPLNIDLINCQSIVNKCDDILGIFRDVDFVALIINMQGFSPEIIGDVTSEGYTFNHAPRTHRKMWGNRYIPS